MLFDFGVSLTAIAAQAYNTTLSLTDQSRLTGSLLLNQLLSNLVEGPFQKVKLFQPMWFPTCMFNSICLHEHGVVLELNTCRLTNLN